MVWMPVSEAAAALGVSERTIWRRIKAATIATRNESGRTFVGLEIPGDGSETVRQLSHVAAAQLSMRKLDADNLAEVLTVLTEYKKSLDSEIRRVRRSSRSALACVVLLLAAVGAGGWYHVHSVIGLEAHHRDAMSKLAAENQAQLDEHKEQAAQAAGLAQARGDEVANLRRLEAERSTQLNAAEAARDQLQCALEERLPALEKVVAGEAVAAQRDRELTTAQETIAQLQQQLRKEQLAYQTMRRESDRAITMLQRTASRNAGEAAGLRLYVKYHQQEEAARIAPTVLAGAAADLRQDMLNSLAAPAASRVPAAPASPARSFHWVRPMLRDWLNAWLGRPSPPAIEGQVVAAGS